MTRYQHRSPCSIAIVIPTYNRPKQMRRAVASVLRQSAFSEIVIVNDAPGFPPDLSGLSDRRVIYRTHSHNQGVSAARNSGIAATAASHLVFLDDDDVLLPWAGRVFARWLCKSSDASDKIMVGGVWVNRDKGRPQWRRPPSSRAGEIWGLDRHLLQGNKSFATKQAALIPRTLLDRVGGWDVTLKSRVTSDLFIRLTQIADVEATAIPLYALNRQSHNRLTANRSQRRDSYDALTLKHADLLKDPARRDTLEANHKWMLGQPDR